MPFVHIGGNHSTKHLYGVPQGSALGPKLFNSLIHEICDLCIMIHFLMSADDRKTIICFGKANTDK